ncbi:MAG: DMT family transporter [Clostridia bacterium]|nr:DMT family transporter [Clostridia bacterium]
MNKHGISPALRGNLLLLLTAFIWGIAFVAQKSGGAALGALTFNGVRSFIGCGGLLAAIPLLDRLGLSHPCVDRAQRKKLWIAGICCGAALFAATNMQQLGLLTTTVGKGGFVTALYIVLVPLIGMFIGKKTTWLNWLGVAPAVSGLYLLCAPEGGGIATGDILLLICALLFSIQILLVAYFAPQVDGVRLSCIQFLTVGVLNIPLMFIFEQPSLTAMADNWLPLVYAGLMSSGVAYTLQIIAQRDTHPTVASLLMSLESVFAVLAGAILLGDRLSVPEWIGCGLMFMAIIITQLPTPVKKESKHG